MEQMGMQSWAGSHSRTRNFSSLWQLIHKAFPGPGAIPDPPRMSWAVEHTMLLSLAFGQGLERAPFRG